MAYGAASLRAGVSLLVASMWLWWSLAHDMIGGLWSNLGWQRVAAAWAPVPTVLSFVVAAIASIGAGVAIGPRERISGFA